LAEVSGARSREGDCQIGQSWADYWLSQPLPEKPGNDWEKISFPVWLWDGYWSKILSEGQSWQGLLIKKSKMWYDNNFMLAEAALLPNHKRLVVFRSGFCSFFANNFRDLKGRGKKETLKS
jgi:hypothetical protein